MMPTMMPIVTLLLGSHSLFSACVKQNRLDSLSVMLPLCLFVFVSVSTPSFIPLSFNNPPGNGSEERSLHKAKAGTSLPVYIKDLSFKATGSAVRQCGEKDGNIKDRN